MTDRADPLGNFRFSVGLEINGIVVAGFSEVSGLSLEVETEDYAEGGVNDFVHKLPKAAKYQNVSLKKGLTDSDTLWLWARESIDGKFEKLSVDVVLMDLEGNEKWRWSVQDAYPVKWSGPELKGDSSEIAIEALELAHTGITKA
jgi:phage tail-like protein